MLQLEEIGFIISSYLLGSIPFGFILYYLTEKKDIRAEGSGNIGATNVLRNKGKTAGIITLALDMLKSVIAIAYGLNRFDSPAVVILGGAAVVLGHLFPLYLKFKGGKGVASFLGIFLVFDFPAALVFGGGFLAAFAFTRYVSAGSIIGAAAVFFFITFTHTVEVSAVVLGLTIMIIVKHRSNVTRIMERSENIFCWKKNG